MSHLVPCLSCNRHVSTSDESCPFCGVALSSEQRASVPLELPRRRLGRAALFTLGATLIGGAACSDGSSNGNDAGRDTPAADAVDGGGSGGTGAGGAGTGGTGAGGAGTGGKGSGGGTGTGGAGTGGNATGGSGGFAPPYGIAPLYGSPPREE